MRKICLFSILCLCTNLFGETSFTAIMPGEEGSTVLHMERNGEKYKLVDHNGLATLAAIHSLATRDTYENIMSGKEFWDDARDREVPGQTVTAMVAQLQRMERHLQSLNEDDRKALMSVAMPEKTPPPVDFWTRVFQTSEMRKDLAASEERLRKQKKFVADSLSKRMQAVDVIRKEIADLVASWKTSTKVTYDSLNDLGVWMRKYACYSAYDVQTSVGGKTEAGSASLCPEIKSTHEKQVQPAIGMLLGGRGFVLGDRTSLQTAVPPQYQRDRWVMEGDLNLILRNFDARLQAGNGPGRGQALDALTSGGTGIRRETVGGREPDTHL